MPDSQHPVAEERSVQRSIELAERARQLVPGASHTGSKSPKQFVQGVSPTHIERAEGSRLWDVDGNEYIDCNAALGPIVLGYNYDDVDDAVTEQIQDGTLFTMEHPLHLDVVERMTEMVPCAEMVKFAKSGNDVTTLAAKVARASTGRDVVATQGYHGWPDVWMGANENMNAGIPDEVGQHTEPFEYNDIESVERIFEDNPDDVAAIVTTPVNLEPPEDDFIQQLHEIADREDALLVFDEVLTGFRFAPGGAQEYFDVTPDLACFAKAMANGYPISALAGKREYMETLERSDFFYSMTYAGDAASLAAADATLSILEDEPVHDHIFSIGEQLRDGYNDLAAELSLAEVTEATGYPPRFSIGFADEVATAAPTDDTDIDRLIRTLFMQEAHKNGILFTGSHIPTYSHTEADVEATLDGYRESLQVVADAIEADDIEARIDGDLVGATLRDRTDEN